MDFGKIHPKISSTEFPSDAAVIRLPLIKPPALRDDNPASFVSLKNAAFSAYSSFLFYCLYFCKKIKPQPQEKKPLESAEREKCLKKLKKNGKAASF